MMSSDINVLRNLVSVSEAVITKATQKGFFCRFAYSRDPSNRVTEGFVKDAVWNNLTKQKFKENDQVDVKCFQLGTNDFRFHLTEKYVKPLLIFDMNGVLGDREPFRAGHKRKFVKRPYLDDFLQKFSQHFVFAVWSSCLEKNIDTSIFKKHKENLLFVWHSKQCTYVPSRHSCKSAEKPLFHKELRRVWEEYPSYSHLNTLLLDNDVEKCEANPVGTCLIVPDFELTSHCLETDSMLKVDDGPLSTTLMDLVRNCYSSSRVPPPSSLGEDVSLPSEARLAGHTYILQNFVGRSPFFPEHYMGQHPDYLFESGAMSVRQDCATLNVPSAWAGDSHTVDTIDLKADVAGSMVGISGVDVDMHIGRTWNGDVCDGTSLKSYVYISNSSSEINGGNGESDVDEIDGGGKERGYSSPFDTSQYRPVTPTMEPNFDSTDESSDGETDGDGKEGGRR